MKKMAIVIVNLLTTVRVVGVGCLLPIYLKHGGVAAALLSMGCYFTDWIDGVIARKCHASTFFGSTYDGVADKMFSVANLIVLFTITKYAIVPIIFEALIIVVQTIKYHHNENVKSSNMGKLKTWIISFTVISLYLLIDIKALTFLPAGLINNILSYNQTKLFGAIFAPLYVFEVLTLLSYLRFLKGNEPDVKTEIPKIDIKLKPVHSLKDRFDNWCYLWLNNEFYEKYKDCAGLKKIKKSIQHGS
ncbi:MAG: CDP-alcohol phosphatidyltransferase family protein [Firmicutes bacterium]|nr:CDP-alcohol phosphatidyltransferase family protein [Bacillota bacterium]